MKTALAYVLIGFLALAVVSATTPGCRKEEPTEKESAEKPVEAEKGVDADTTAALEAKLVKADALDGVTDKVVSKCPSCALAMDGSSAHALETSGYTLHFCSAPCKTGFEKDTTKAILALNIPGE